MRWNTDTRYKMLLQINNAVVTRNNREELFQALAKELRKHFAYDRMCINLYDQRKDSICYFAAADGIRPDGILAQESRPLADGAIVRMVLRSKQPTIIDDLRRYSDMSSVGALVKAGLNATMAFPLVVRGQVLGSIHLSYRKAPKGISELTEVLTDVSKQVAIAVDNMLAYTELQQRNVNLKQEKRYLLRQSDEYIEEDFFYASSAMAKIMSLIERSADTDATVLLTGETGTGKDYLARCIHNMSARREHLFVKTSCPALTPSLFESELFGHAKGAFTGADNRKVGRFELANGGTIFLDEVGELPISLQAKLLHVLQDNRFERVGDSRPIQVDFRVIAATNKNLEDSIRAGQFRQDLYYRLNIVNIHVPPLRERRDDVPLLIRKLTEIQARKTNRPAPRYSNRAMEMLCCYHWPGNVRELKNLVKRMVILHPGETLRTSDLEVLLNTTVEKQVPNKSIEALSEIERQHIIKALIKTRGVVGGRYGASRLLGLPRSTLQYRLKKFSITPQEYAR